MTIETKYQLGDTVYTTSYMQIHKRRIEGVKFIKQNKKTEIQYLIDGASFSEAIWAPEQILFPDVKSAKQYIIDNITIT